jgi:hypothetical protein
MGRYTKTTKKKEVSIQTVRAKKVIVLIFCIIILLWVVKIWIANSLLPNNYLYSRLLTEHEEVERKNIILREEILYYQSLTTIRQMALEEGFAPAIYFLVR